MENKETLVKGKQWNERKNTESCYSSFPFHRFGKKEAKGRRARNGTFLQFCSLLEFHRLLFEGKYRKIRKTRNPPIQFIFAPFWKKEKFFLKRRIQLFHIFSFPPVRETRGKKGKARNRVVPLPFICKRDIQLRTKNSKDYLHLFLEKGKTNKESRYSTFFPVPTRKKGKPSHCLPVVKLKKNEDFILIIPPSFPFLWNDRQKTRNVSFLSWNLSFQNQGILEFPLSSFPCEVFE